MGVGEQLVDGHVDELVVGVVDELKYATRNRLATGSGPDAEFPTPWPGEFEFTQRAFEASDEVFIVQAQGLEGSLVGDSRERL